MNLRWMLFAPFVMLILIAGYTGIKLSIERQNVTEGTVIEFYAKQYLADHTAQIGPIEQAGAAVTDCVGVPGQTGAIWVEVQCTPPGGEPAFYYGINRNGGMEYAARRTLEDS